MLTANEIRQNLGHFCFTQEHHRVNPMFRMVCTDGVFWLLQNADAHWLFDAIASYQGTLRKNPQLKSFQHWVLSVGGRDEKTEEISFPFLIPKKKNIGLLTCWWDTPVVGVKPSVKQVIGCTNFPLTEIRFFLEEGVLLLPREH